ncbi:MAG: glycosyltransferase, partial [Prevotella sp.]|nr:glycosyltransferase [Prevotella sp.]
SNPNLYHRINNRLCDFHGAKIWDSCIAISNFLEQKAKEVRKDIPVIKVTPLCDFDLFAANNDEVDVKEPYLMFCGSAGYFDVVKFIIDSYNRSAIMNSKKLLLVLSGSETQLDRVREYEANAIIRTKLPYNMLVAYYKHAYGLMIPLRNTTEDIARFPNKVCEYTAAKGLIITTCYGEMPYYFKNGENAIVADDCTVEAIAKRLDEIEKGIYDIARIKENAYQTGMDNFSIHAYRHNLINFLEELNHE